MGILAISSKNIKKAAMQTCRMQCMLMEESVLFLEFSEQMVRRRKQ